MLYLIMFHWPFSLDLVQWASNFAQRYPRFWFVFFVGKLDGLGSCRGNGFKKISNKREFHVLLICTGPSEKSFHQELNGNWVC